MEYLTDICFLLEGMNNFGDLHGVQSDVSGLVGELEKNINGLSKNDYIEISKIPTVGVPDTVLVPIQELNNTVLKINALGGSVGLLKGDGVVNCADISITKEGQRANLEGMGIKFMDFESDLAFMKSNRSRIWAAREVFQKNYKPHTSQFFKGP